MKYIDWIGSTHAKGTRRLFWVGFALLLGFGALEWLGILSGSTIVQFLPIAGFACLITSALMVYSNRKLAAVRVFMSGKHHEIVLDEVKVGLAYTAIAHAIAGVQPPLLPRLVVTEPKN